MKRIYRQAGGALAMAVLGSVGAAHAYEWQINDDTTFGISGTIELAYTNTDTGDDHERELIDNGSGLTFFGEHAFTNDLSAYFAAEFDYNVDETDDSSFSTDEAFFGVRSNFGAVRIGDWDGIYEDTIEDLLDVFEVAEPTNTEDFRTEEVGDAVAYFSPSFNGFSFAVQGFFKGEGEGQDFDDPADGDTDNGQSFQATVGYEAGRFGAWLGYDNNGLDDDADGTIGLGGAVDLSPVALAAKVESVGEDSSPTDGPLDEEGYMLYGVAAIYDYGIGAITGAVNQVDPGDGNLDSYTEFGVNVNYEIADNFYVYLEHFRYDREDDLGNSSAAGLVYAF